MLLVLYMLFVISAFERIGHDTDVPAGTPHRHSLILNFFLLPITYGGFSRIYKCKKGYICVGHLFSVLCGSP